MPSDRLGNSQPSSLRQFVDAVLALSGESNQANVERYLAESSALEHHRRDHFVSGARGRRSLSRLTSTTNTGKGTQDD